MKSRLARARIAQLGIVAFAASLILIGSGDSGCDTATSPASPDNSTLLAQYDLWPQSSPAAPTILTVGETDSMDVVVYGKEGPSSPAGSLDSTTKFTVAQTNPVAMRYDGRTYAAIDDKGHQYFHVTATAPGATTFSITPHLQEATPANFSYQVYPVFRVTAPTISTTLVGLSVSAQFTANDSVRTWSSSGQLPPGLTLSSAGLLSGALQQAGSYTFYVKATSVHDGTPEITKGHNYQGEDSASVTLTIAAPAASMRPSSLTLSVGDTARLQLLDANGQPLSNAFWASVDPTIATVNTSGLVTATGPGSVNVTATLAGVTVGAVVRVTVPVASILLSPGDTTVNGPLPVAIPMRATLLGPNGAAGPNLPLSWFSSAPSVASVDNTGLVTVLSQGVAAITVTAGGARATSTITADTTPVRGTITGVATANGKPVNAALISAAHQPDGFTIQTVTLPDGSYALGLLAGTYEMSASLNGFTAPRTTVNLAGGRTVTVNFPFTAITNSRFSGYATYAGTSTPIANGTVYVDPGNGRPVLQFTTGTDGSFTTSLIAAGTYQLSVQPPGQPTGPAQSFTLADSTVQMVSLTAPGEGRITGTITQSTGAPAAGATVTFSYGCMTAPPVTVTTDANGHFTSPFLSAPVTWTVTATYSGLTASTSAAVTYGGMATATIQLPAPVLHAKFTGVLYYSGTTTPVVNGTVVAAPDTTHYHTDANGVYSTNDETPGSYTLTGSWGSGLSGSPVAASLAAGQTDTVNLDAPAEGYATGHVATSTGANAVNATVTLSYTGMSGSPISLTTDSVGNWGPVLLPAPVQWTANASLYGGTGSTTFTTQLGGTVSASVQLNSPGTPNSIVGHVTFIGKLAPAINAQVTLSPGGLTTTADSSGTYSFSPLSDGTYTLQASWNGYTAGPSVTQSVSAGAVATVDLTAYGSEFINTLVLSSGGTAVQGAVLTYSYPGIPAPPASDTTDSSGRVYKYLEAPRTWTITATYGGSTGSVTITTSPGSVTSATIHLSP